MVLFGNMNYILHNFLKSVEANIRKKYLDIGLQLNKNMSPINCVLVYPRDLELVFILKVQNQINTYQHDKASFTAVQSMLMNTFQLNPSN
jgi:hypothetical protein